MFSPKIEGMCNHQQFIFVGVRLAVHTCVPSFWDFKRWFDELQLWHPRSLDRDKIGERWNFKQLDSSLVHCCLIEVRLLVGEGLSLNRKSCDARFGDSGRVYFLSMTAEADEDVNPNPVCRRWWYLLDLISIEIQV